MAKQSHKYQNYIVFDFETGGISKNTSAAIQNAATEVAIVILDGFSLKVIDTYTSLIKPYSDTLIYGLDAATATGITKEMCEEEGIDLNVVVINIIDIIKRNCPHGNKYLPVLVGHNVLFDIGFLQQIFFYTKNALDKLISGEDNFYNQFTPKHFDTQTLSMSKYAQDPKVIKHSLGFCMEKEGVEFSDAHRALPDTLATAELFSSYMQSLRSETQNQSLQKSSKSRHFQFD